MFFISSPFRVSVLGGGTDYPSFFNTRKGRTIGFAINHGSLISLNPNPNIDSRYRFAYSIIESCMTAQDIHHPMFRSYIEHYYNLPVEIHYDASFPKATGLGTSSSLACSLVAGFLHLNKLPLDPFIIASEAIRLERSYMSENGGWQDQIYSAYGGLLDIEYEHDQFVVSRILPSNRAVTLFEENMFLLIVQRNTSVDSREKAMHYFNTNISIATEFDILYGDLKKSLYAGDLHLFGRLLSEAQRIKQKFTLIHNPLSSYISDILTQLSIPHKVCGSGSGGAIFGIAPTELRNEAILVLQQSSNISAIFHPLRFSNQGTHLVSPFEP